MEEWSFLSPWAIALAPLLAFKEDRESSTHAEREDTDRSWELIKRGCSMLPNRWIRIRADSSHQHSHEVVARALEILMLAFRVDSSAWGQLRHEICRSKNYVFSNRFRFDYIEPRVKLYCNWVSGNAKSISDSRDYFVPRARDSPDRFYTNGIYPWPISASYEDHKERIADLDVKGKLEGYLIPLSIKFEDAGYRTRTVEFLESLLSTGTVIVGNSPPTAGAVYRLTEIHFCVLVNGWRPGTDAPIRQHTENSLTNLPTSQPDDDASVLAFNRLSDLGVPITSFRGLAEDNPEFLTWITGDYPVRVELYIDSPGSFRGAHAACIHFGARLKTLLVGTSLNGSDLGLVAQFLTNIPSTCPELEHLELRSGANMVDMSEIVQFASHYTHSWRSSEHRLSWIESLAIREPFNDAKSFLRAIAIISQSVPRLRSLALRSSSPGVITDRCFTLILKSFPVLSSLDLSVVHLKSMAKLLSAYEDGTCCIRQLSLHAFRPKVAPLFQALADPGARISRTLTELSIGCVNPPRDSIIAQLGDMLKANRRLEYLRLENFDGSNRSRAITENVLLPFQRPRRDEQFRRSYLAFLSLTRLVSCCGWLDTFLLASIYDFVGKPPYIRSIVVV